MPPLFSFFFSRRCNYGAPLVFFSSSPSLALAVLIITHYSCFCFPSSQLTSTAFWEKKKKIAKRLRVCIRFTCNLSLRSAFPSQTGGKKEALCSKRQHIRILSAPMMLRKKKKRSSLGWNINSLRMQHSESETSSNLMQEKTAIWLGKRPSSSPLCIPSSPSSSKCRAIKVMCSSA